MDNKNILENNLKLNCNNINHDEEIEMNSRSVNKII